MTKAKQQIKVKDKPKIADSLNEIAERSGSSNTKVANTKKVDESEPETLEDDAYYAKFLELWETDGIYPKDFKVDVPIDSLESAVGYSSLFRQMHQAFIRIVAFYRSSAGGSLSIEDARKGCISPVQR
jgi:hypothetical protein